MTEENFADAITNMGCANCKSNDSWMVGRKLMGGSNNKIFLVCSKCGVHCTVTISPHYELLQEWWK